MRGLCCWTAFPSSTSFAYPTHLHQAFILSSSPQATVDKALHILDLQPTHYPHSFFPPFFLLPPQATVDKALHILDLYSQQGVDPSRIYIKARVLPSAFCLRPFYLSSRAVSSFSHRQCHPFRLPPLHSWHADCLHLGGHPRLRAAAEAAH